MDKPQSGAAKRKAKRLKEAKEAKLMKHVGLDFEGLVQDFASKKARKKLL